VPHATVTRRSHVEASQTADNKTSKGSMFGFVGDASNEVVYAYR
jgi:hypothetical protein